MNNPVKRTIAADIVVLVDVSSSMARTVDAIRSAWVSFVGQLLDPATTDGPRVDLRLKVVGYAVSEDGIQPVIQDNPFVQNDVAAFAAQFAKLKVMPTDQSPRPLLDALWQTMSVGSMPREQEVMTSAQWRDRNVARRIVAILTDAPFREEVQIQKARGAIVEDVIRLVMENRITLDILAPEHECYYELGKADRSKVSFGNVVELLEELNWQKSIMKEIVAH